MVASPERDQRRELSPLIPFAPQQWIAPLPVPLTPLVGREREIAAACDLLRGQARLLTLTGPGGIGKTRLALAVAEELATDYPDGVVWVPLASVVDSAGVAPAIGRALGIHDSGDQPPIERVKMAVRDAKLLLLLDNFEQVVAAAPHVTELLLASPDLRVLVTSRARLRLAGEHTLPVPPLSLPGGEGERRRGGEDDKATLPLSLSPSLPLKSDAVRLFADCAVAANPSFELTETNAETVVEICRRLDGLPLAIELAAARVTHLALPALLERLEHRLPLLTTGGPDRPPRQQTLRDAVAWSYDLLTPDEQALFRRLSVFVGGFTLEAAEAVGDAGRGTRDEERRADGQTGRRAEEPGAWRPTPDASSVSSLELLGSLVENSLVRLEPSASGGPRYAALETVREFAAEQLAAAGEDLATRDAHAAYFLDLAEGCATLLDRANDPAVMQRMDAEHANVRAAMSHIGQQGPIGEFVRFAAALGFYWFVHGHALEAREWVERAWESSDPRSPTTRVRLARALGYMRLGRNLPDEAEAILNAGLAVARANQDAWGMTRMLTMLGVVDSSRGRYEAAIASIQEALVVADRVDDPLDALLLASTAHANLGVALRGLGRLDEAGVHYRTGLEGHRAAGSARGEMDSLVDLGDLALDTGDLPEAAARYRASLELAWARGERRALFGSLGGLACVAAARGEAEAAARWFAAAERVSEISGIGVWTPADQATVARGIAQARATLGDNAFTAAWKVGREQPLAQTVVDALVASDPTVQIEPAVSEGTTATRIDLTARQLEILRLLVAGRTDREIAEAHFLSVRTVEAHVARILTKLGVRSRTAAAGAAIAAGLVDAAAVPGDGEIP